MLNYVKTDKHKLWTKRVSKKFVKKSYAPKAFENPIYKNWFCLAEK